MSRTKQQSRRIDAEATISWAGWGGEVRGGSGALRAHTATQVELGGPGDGTNPEELLAAALANCYTSTITALARSRAIDLVNVETKARTRLSWSQVTPHHIAQGSLAVRVTTPSPKRQVLALAKDAKNHCPVCIVLAATTPVRLSIFVVVSPSPPPRRR